jgi:hypothetical protein
VRFVECLAAMGSVNPVFERAGMARVGQCAVPRGRLALLKRLERWSVDPFAPDFPEVLARCPRVRQLVESTVRRWVIATQGGHHYRVEGRDAATLTRAFRQVIGEPPVYYLWDRQGVYPRQPGDDEFLCDPSHTVARTRPDSSPSGARGHLRRRADGGDAAPSAAPRLDRRDPRG